ncbi:MAG: histidinol-phosphate transaminase [Clostridiaceae bacterium]|nr:histidinol-phosphate transaminase [Clostridiaceae bacterium]
MKLPDKLMQMEPYTPSVDHFDVKLDANENAVTVDVEAQARILEVIEKVELNRYPDPAATALRQAAAGVYGVTAANIGCGCGSDEIISILMNNFLSRGDTVVMSEFDFSMYAFYAHNAELRVVSVPTDDKLRLNPDALIDAVRHSHAGMLIFSNPCNPTGQGLPRDVVRRIIEKADCLVVVDEAYMDFWNQSVADEVDEYDNLIVLRTCSKAYGLAAIRCGFLLSNTKLVGYYDNVRSPYNVNALTQAAGVAVLSDPEMTCRMAQACTRRADSLRLMARGLCAAHAWYIEYIPTVTNFALLRPKEQGDWNAAYCYEQLKARRIGVRLLKDQYLRITAGTDAENSAVILALDDILTDWEESK